MQETMRGELTKSQIAAWLVALKMKGETLEEIKAFTEVIRDKATHLPELGHDLIDTCGTGGDRSNSINISTLSGIVLASMQIPVAKHGNRAVSSKSGSADILEKLGYPLNETPAEIVSRIKENYFGFIFAPNFHPAMKQANLVRKELSISTIFNFLGPLSNPVRVNFHLLGVYKKSLLDTFIQLLSQIGLKSALVVSSEDRLDEISPIERTEYRLLMNNEITAGMINPSTLPLKIQNLREISAENLEEALSKSIKILEGNFQAGIEAVALNVAAAKFLWETKEENSTRDLQKYLEKNLADIIYFIKSKKALELVNSWKK